MGKPTGFIEYLREIPLDRSAIERIKDWKEFHYHMPEDKLRTQGARCMDCGVPFCHTGQLISGMASGCPINKDRKSTRLNSSHLVISYAVFCLKKKNGYET